MINKKMIISFIVIGILALQIGCTGKKSEDNDLPTPQDNIEEDTILEEFDTLSKGSGNLGEMVAYMNENISLLSEENASIMLIKFEEAQKNNLQYLEEKFYDEVIQVEIFEIFKERFNLEDIGKTENENLRKLLEETKETGYKVETAEGMFFPIIHYEFYKQYSDFVTDDIKSYIDIMAVESNEVPAKDAALVISWEELINRALKLEEFNNQYTDSLKKESIKLLYKDYIRFTLLGLNNTPLFDYDSKLINEEARIAFEKAIENNKDSEFVELLVEYLNVLEENEYKLTNEVDAFRKDKLDNIK